MMHEHLSQRSALIAKATPGTAAARQLAEISDEAVRELARAASLSFTGRWAIIALGGWGSGHLLPASDLDILVLSDAPAHRLQPFVEALLYPLWDAGLKVGHQVRSPREQLLAMRTDMATRTAGLTGRAIAGDTQWAQTHLNAWARDAHRKAKRSLRTLTARPRPGSPWSLEVDLKHGAGGRRDFDEITWTSAILTGSPASDPATMKNELQLLSEGEFSDLMQAAERVCAARWVLQREGLGDVLTIEAASLLGDEAERLQEALGTTAVVLDRVRGRISRAIMLDDAWTAEQLFAALDTDDEGLACLELAAQAGQLERVLPGFHSLMSVRRPGIGHELTVGAHCLRTAWLVGRSADDPALARSREVTGDLTPVRLAALVHDAAKAECARDHARLGAEPAHATALSLGLSADEATLVAELVRHHLVLAETALHGDLNDENVVLQCASRIGDGRLVAPLHLLTAADSMATSRASWTNWTASLVTSLVARLDAALSPEVGGAGLATLGVRVRKTVLADLPASKRAERAFVTSAPLRYLAARDSDCVKRDAALVAELLASGGAQRLLTVVSAGPITGTASVTVAALDRPFLLSAIAGAASLAGLNILSLDAYGTVDGVALDTLVVESASEKALLPSTFASFERFIHSGLADKYALSTRLEERKRHYPSRAEGPMEVRVADSGWDTTVRVRVPSRPGLLHDLASAVSSAGLDIRWARANTINGIADDTFHVTGEDGGPVDDPGVLGHLSMHLREAATPKRA